MSDKEWINVPLPKKRYLVPLHFFGGGIDYVEFDSEEEFLKLREQPQEAYFRAMYMLLLDQKGFETTEENLKEVMPRAWPCGPDDEMFPTPKLTKKADQPIVREEPQ